MKESIMKSATNSSSNCDNCKNTQHIYFFQGRRHGTAVKWVEAYLSHQPNDHTAISNDEDLAVVEKI